MADVVVSRYTGRPPRHLPILVIFITTRCNLACRMCGVCDYNPVHSRPELSTDEWKSVLDAAARLGTTLLSIGGGEPLLRPDLYEIIGYARDLGMSVHLCTNGVLLSEENVVKLRESRVNTVSVSIENPVREVHENLRGLGTFDASVEGIRRLRALAPEIRVGINFVISTISYRQMAETVAFAESLGVHQLKFAPIHMNLLHKSKPVEEFRELVFKPEDLESLDAEIRRLVAALRKSPLQTNSPSFLHGMSRLYRDALSFRCYAGYAICAVNPAGTVVPCCDMEGTLSVRNMPLDQIWRDPEFHRLRRKVSTCRAACWDTTNTEVSLRLAPVSLLRDLGQTWRDFRYYFGSR
jgi:MoaA/NifB/PqqE/SkfB family radical SAM enzyme